MRRTWSRRRGPLRLADHDPVAVGVILSGVPDGGRTVDYWEAVRRLHARQLTDGQIGERIRKGRKTVWRIRHRLGLPPVVPPGASARVVAPTLPKRSR